MPVMTDETFKIGLNHAMSSLQYVEKAEAMERLVEKANFSHEDAFLCVCAAEVLLKNQVEVSNVE